MDERLGYFLENTVVTQAAVHSRVSHPVTGVVYPHRMAFVLLRKYADDFFSSGSEPRFIALAGLRGVGKTTLMWHTAEHLLNSHVSKAYFFNVNTLRTLGIDLHAALEEFQRQVLKKRFNELTEPIALLFDEVHDDPNWSKTLKILYDEARSAFILCTGSSALLLRQTADLARRMRVERIYPYSFPEWVLAKSTMSEGPGPVFPEKGLADSLKTALFFSETPAEVFQKLESLTQEIVRYLSGATRSLGLAELLQDYISFQNIPSFLFFQEKTTIADSILDLLKRVVHEDVPKLNPYFTDFSKIERLLLRLAGSDEVNPEKLSGIIGMKQSEILEVMDILALAELLTVLMPYGGLDTRIVKNKKAFFMSPSLRRALLSSLYGQDLPEQFRSKLMEDAVVMYLRRLLPDSVVSFVTGNTSNPDFVIETRDKPVLLELGTGKTSARQIKTAGLEYRYGLLVSSGLDAPSLSGDCVSLPISWFLLL
jgi:hypothetical protein